MSKGRQNHFGIIRVMGFSVFVGMIVLWCLPAVLLHVFPQWQVVSTSPWLMTPKDLSWHRVLINLMTKPGFRLIALGGFGLIGWLITVLFVKLKLIRPLPVWRELSSRLKTWRLSTSTEWAVDGRRATSLVEYARCVGAIH